MTTLYDLFRTTWPGTVPAEQPDGLMLAKRIVKRLTPYRPTAGGLFVVLTGELRETVRSVGGRDAVIAHWGARTHVPMVAGTLYATMESHVLEVAAGWEQCMPCVSAQHIQAQRDYAATLALRLATAMRDPYKEQIQRYVEAHPSVRSATTVANAVGCSREMADHVLRTMGRKAVAA